MSATKTATRLLRSRLLDSLTFPHGTERYVELIDPLASRTDVRAEITDVSHQSARSVTLTLAPNENWGGALAGQFVGLGVEIDGRRESRPYSPAGSEHQPGGVLEFTVSTHPDGLVSQHLRERARPGMIVHLEQAAGDFVLPSPRPERVLLISGGSGITPVMAMLRTLCDEGHSDEIGFLNYARSPELALYEPELEALASQHSALRVARGYTQPSGEPGESERPTLALAGRFSPGHLDAVISDAADATTFVCGPPALIDAVRSRWAAKGLPEPTVETFAPPRIALNPAPGSALDPALAEGTVRLASSELEFDNSGLPLLEQAEDAGLQPEHGCRMGICNTCSCRKTSGTVRNLLTGETSSKADELIRICVSVPVGDVEITL